MKKFRIVSAVLAILLALSAVSLPVFADDTTTTIDISTYPTTEYLSQKAKVDTMTLMYEDPDAGYAMYVDKQSGEFALQNLKTGEYLFSNPYDIGVNSESSSSSNGNNDAIRQALLSQVILQYQDTLTNSSATLKSYTDAALAGEQIVFKNISGGIRVEYAIGTVDTKRLIPQWIEKSRFETQILAVLDTHVSEFSSEEMQLYTALKNATSATSTPYALVGPAASGAVYDPQSTPQPEKPETYKYLVENTGAQMYVLQGVGERMKKSIEQLIRKYCPDYTYDKLEEDHELTGYEGNEKEPPLFRLAIEYTIDETGLTASIPAKSIRYNETNYVLESIVLLPYLGCSTLKETGETTSSEGSVSRTGGYIFIPDGSGTLLSYYNDDGSIKSGIQGGSMYGFDYAYETLDATNVNAETFRIPVFGLTEYYDVTKSVSRGDYRPAVGNKLVTESYKRGFVAIIEEGDSFASIRANLRQTGWTGASGTTEYSTVFALFTVKQTDSVNVGTSIGGTSSSMSTTTASAAALAWASVSAATMAMASPNWNIFSSQSTGRSQPSHLLLRGSMTRPFILFLPPAATMSLAVMILATPGIFSAAEVSTDLMRAWLTLAWTRARRRVPSGIFSASSAPKSQVPVTFWAAEGLMYLVPTMESPVGLKIRSSLLISPLMTLAASMTASTRGL